MKYYVYYPELNAWGRVYEFISNELSEGYSIHASLSTATAFPDRESAEKRASRWHTYEHQILDSDTVFMLEVMKS